MAASMVATALFVVACGSGGVPASPSGDNGSAGAATSTPSPTPLASSEPAGPAVWLPEWADAATPREVVNRRPLPFCGVEEAPLPRPGEYIDATVRNCFWSAKVDGREAEFASVQPTMEGAKIATIYRLRPDGGVDVLFDATQDPFGGGNWTVTACDSLVAEPGERLFGQDGCGEARPLQ
jgi:hypothetical protein